MSRILTSSLAAALLAAIATSAPAGRFVAMRPAASPRKPAEYKAYSSLPALTGEASAPVTVTPQKPVVFFTITGRDMDMWRIVSDGSVMQRPDDRLVCVKSAEQYPTDGPQLRGNMDDVSTWDLVGNPDFADRDVPKGETRYKPTEMYINTYLVGNTKSKNDTKQDDAPVFCQQVIIYTGHEVRGQEIPHPAFAAKNSVSPTKAQIARHDDTSLSTPDFIRKRIGPSEALRHDMEKRLTKKQKTGLQNGEYVAFALGSLPTDLREKAFRYIRVCNAIGYAPASVDAVINAPKPPRWEEYQIRFLPESAGVNYQILGIVTVDQNGDKVYF